ncbi:hypothetical protein [Actinomadura latina]|uniref:Nucleotide exchange factor GrpE n=1 Tax=Actinomadura latina TaxID=163603 RepID=A0A846Z6L2_9ACTN|nr:hypothetical protein [Actinomadura latina]NKZ06298.1 hypothetical protein [Actinomadura latina]
MEESLIVVSRLPGADGGVRTGDLLERKGGVLSVRWHDDGREEDVRISGTTTFAPRGSLRHRSFVDPEALRSWWERDALGLIARLLRETDSAMNAAAIKERLRNLGLEPDSVDTEWKRAQTKLSSRDDIVVKKGTYTWHGPRETTKLPSAVASVPGDAEPGQADGDSVAEAVEEVNQAVEAGAETEEAREIPDTSAAGNASPSNRTPTAEAPLPVGEVISNAIGVSPAADERALLSRPLRTGAGLGQLTSRDVERVLGEATPDDKAIVMTLLFSRPQKTPVLDTHDIDPAALTALLEAAIAEIRGTDDDGLCAAATWLLRRAVAAEPPPAPGPIVELASLVAAETGRSEFDALDRVVQELGERLPGPMRDGADPDALARFAPRLPFKAGRAALIVAVAELWPERVTDPAWWRDATAEGLAALAQGALRRVLVRPDVAQRVISPVMERELASVTSRTRLARLMALPSEFVEHLQAGEVAAAFQRAAVDDPYASAWLDALEGRERVASLRQELDRAQEEVKEAAERRVHAEAQAADMSARYADLELRLQQQHDRVAGLRASQGRQLQIDAIRALAELAAEVEELAAANTGPEVMVERVRGLVSAQEIEPIGEVGGQVAFDRALHEPLMGAPAADTAVTVLRPGYRWRAGGEDVLLHRAVVSVE